MMLDRLALRCAWYGVLKPECLADTPYLTNPHHSPVSALVWRTPLTQIHDIVLGIPPLISRIIGNVHSRLTDNAVELCFLRRSGIACPGQGLPGDRRNLGSMDGRASERPCNLDTGDPCRYDGLFQQYCA